MKTVDVNAAFIREAKHTRDTQLTGSFNAKLQFSTQKAKLPHTARNYLLT